ncbi:FAD-dependent oxidoreductase [Ferrimonas balearica]|nr:FAD-dependent oxidoreductase [Ferrimonas balearica]
MKLTDTVRTGTAEPLPSSLYAAGISEEPRRPLRENRDADVVIIGAGILGLSTALALAERGVTPLVLEANSAGWGASGRNGGQVNSGLKHSPDKVARNLGAETVRFAYGAPRVVKDLVARLDLDCDYVNGGSYRAARDLPGCRDAEALVAECIRHGIPAEFHGARRMAAATGTDRYSGALFDPEAGQLNPLKYSLSLARAARTAGAMIFEDSPVTQARATSEGWELTTPRGRVRAGRMLVATNGYSGGVLPRLRRSVLPIFSTVVATSPLPQALRERILAAREVLYETSLVTVYYRIDAAGRLVFGGRGGQCPASGVGSARSLCGLAEEIWPALRGQGWAYGWNGRLALTLDHTPHLHALAGPGLACVGFNGRGVALSTALGPRLAEALIDDRPDAVPLPLTPMQPVPFQRFWPTGVSIALGWHQVKQRLSFGRARL